MLCVVEVVESESYALMAHLCSRTAVIGSHGDERQIEAEIEQVAWFPNISKHCRDWVR